MDEDILSDDNFFSLKEAVAAGDERAFRRLYNVFSEKLIQFAFALVKTKHAAIEIVDQVFIKIWLQRANFMLVENIKVYLYAATKNVAFKTPSGKKVLIVENAGAGVTFFNIRFNGKWATTSLSAGAEGTYTWN